MFCFCQSNRPKRATRKTPATSCQGLTSRHQRPGDREAMPSARGEGTKVITTYAIRMRYVMSVSRAAVVRPGGNKSEGKRVEASLLGLFCLFSYWTKCLDGNFSERVRHFRVAHGGSFLFLASFLPSFLRTFLSSFLRALGFDNSRRVVLCRSYISVPIVNLSIN